MKKRPFWILILSIIALLILIYFIFNNQMGEMKLRSTGFTKNQQIPVKYTCDGENINPPLDISGIPGETKSIVLIVDDPDAPFKTWVHWVVFNIPAETREIKEGLF